MRIRVLGMLVLVVVYREKRMALEGLSVYKTLRN